MKLLSAVILAFFFCCTLHADVEETDQATDPTPTRDLDDVIAEILSSEVSDEEYDEAKRCLNKSRIDRTEVLNEHFVVFHMRNKEKYLIQFEKRCYGLKRNRATRFETSSFRICAHDSIQGLIGFGGDGHWGPRCFIPGFEPITKDQLTFIKEELKNQRRR